MKAYSRHNSILLSMAAGLYLTLNLCLSIFPTQGAEAATAKPAASVSAQSQPTRQIRSLVASALAKVAYIREQSSHGKHKPPGDSLTQLNILFDLIEAARPTGGIDALLSFYQQHLSFEDNKQALADVLPLYKATKALPRSKQVKAARYQLDDARTALQNGKRAKALKSLEDMQRSLAIEGIDFPLQAAEEKSPKVTNFYALNNTMPQDGTLLELETDLLEILSSTS